MNYQISNSDRYVVMHCFDRIRQLIGSGVFYDPPPQNILFWSAFTEAIICLHDLLKISDKAAMRVKFADDIDPTHKAADITELIYHVRNAVCHSPSPNHQVGDNIFTFNIAQNKSEYEVFGFQFKCDYDNEIAIFIGFFRVYYYRHFLRAFKEVEANLSPHAL